MTAKKGKIKIVESRLVADIPCHVHYYIKETEKPKLPKKGGVAKVLKLRKKWKKEREKATAKLAKALNKKGGL